MLQGYLDRLQIEWNGKPDVAALRQLHRHHLENIPFENLSVHLGEEIVLDEVELVAKVVARRRGGFCYELNGAFAWLLRRLGYRVDLLEAGVIGPEGLAGQPFDHMVLRVHLDDPWLVDVGFGDNHGEPLPFQTGVDHLDPNGVFRLVASTADPNAVDLWRNGTPQYHLGLRVQPLSAFAAMCRFHQSSPESHFTQNTICSRATPRGRVTVKGHTLMVTEGGTRREHELPDDELLQCYRDTFAIDLARLPRPERGPESSNPSDR